MASGARLAQFFPTDQEFGGTNYAPRSTRNGHPILTFDTTTAQIAVFTGKIPPASGYAGGNIVVAVDSTAATATSGTIGWTVEFERIGTTQDTDTDSFASPQTITAATVNATSGIPNTNSVTVTAGAATDSLAAGELFRIRLTRDVASDNAAGNGEFHCLTLTEA